jgi:hypothetical protein
MRRVTPLVIDSIRPANSLTMHHHDHRWTNYLAHIPRERRVPGELHGAHSAATRGRTALLPAADACAQHHGTDGRRARHPTAARGAKWRDECGGPDSTHAPAVSLPPHLGARCAATQSALAPAMCRKVDSPPSTHTRLGTPGGSFAHAWRPGAAIDINPPSKLPAVAKPSQAAGHYARGVGVPPHGHKLSPLGQRHATTTGTGSQSVVIHAVPVNVAYDSSALLTMCAKLWWEQSTRA